MSLEPKTNLIGGKTVSSYIPKKRLSIFDWVIFSWKHIFEKVWKRTDMEMITNKDKVLELWTATVHNKILFPLTNQVCTLTLFSTRKTELMKIPELVWQEEKNMNLLVGFSSLSIFSLLWIVKHKFSQLNKRSCKQK